MGKLFKLALKQNSDNFPQIGSATKTHSYVDS